MNLLNHWNFIWSSITLNQAVEMQITFPLSFSSFERGLQINKPFHLENFTVLWVYFFGAFGIFWPFWGLKVILNAVKELLKDLGLFLLDFRWAEFRRVSETGVLTTKSLWFLHFLIWKDFVREATLEINLMIDG